MSDKEFYITLFIFIFIIGVIAGLTIHKTIYETYNTEFNKYDVNEDETVNILDAIKILNYIKEGGQE